MMTHWTVAAICKHVIAQDALAGGCVGVGVDESAQFGIIIAGLEVVERGLSVLGLTVRPFTAFLPPRNPANFVGVSKWLSQSPCAENSHGSLV